MATTRVKDISSTATSLASDDYIAVDGATNGTRKMVRGSIYTDVAAAFTGAPTTYDICPLNSGTNKVDATYLPTGAAGTPKGAWDANANSPALADGAGTAGDYYDVTVAGSQDLGSGSIAYTVGDVVKYDGSVWYKIDSVANFLDGYSTAATSRTALEVNSVDEDAEAIGTKILGPSVYFDGSNDFIEVADNAKLSFTDGTDDLPFSGSAWVKFDSAASTYVFSKWGTSAANREYALYISATNDIRLELVDTSGNAAYRDSDTTLSSYDGQWVHLAWSYGGSGPNSTTAFTAAADEITLYVNGSAVASTAVNNASYSGMSDTGQACWIGRYSNSYGQAHIRNVQLYNRELTATEVAELAKGNELGFADEWAGTEIYSGDSSTFTSSLGNWAEEGATSITVAQSGGEMVITNTAASAGTRGANNTVDTLTEGKRYRLTFQCRVSSGTGQQVQVRTFNSSPLSEATVIQGSATTDINNAVVAQFTPTGTNEQWSIEFVVSGGATESLFFNLNNTGNGEVYNIDNISLTEIGTLADFRSERFDSSTGKWYDLSDNAFAGTNNGATLVGREVPVYETGTWTPAFVGATTSDFTYSLQSGDYTRIGDLCYVTGIVSISALGTSAGAITISGLPFTSRNTSGQQMAASIGYASGLTGLTTGLAAAFADAGTSISLWKWAATGVTSVIETDLTNSTDIRFSGTYKIA